MALRTTILAVMLAVLANAPCHASTIDALYKTTAGSDVAKLRQQVAELARLVEAEIEAQGVDAAITAFRQPPWRRQANGFHIWGVTRTGVDWFDTAFPEFEGLVVSDMSDLNGRNAYKLALASADGSGEKAFETHFLHPVLKTAAKGVEQCFPLKDGRRIVCAGAFLDNE
jgi:hypothetical protein